MRHKQLFPYEYASCIYNASQPSLLLMHNFLDPMSMLKFYYLYTVWQQIMVNINA